MWNGVFNKSMYKKNITVPKTARYFVLGEPGEQITTVWFVCHGYGQLASYFIRNFEALQNAHTLVIAPEGLHRFYWERFSGRVVASWMTKEDREEDIIDYVNYLDLVYQQVMQSLNAPHVKVTVLGFSQGTSTVCRWIASGKASIHNLILWAGSLPQDMEFSGAIFNRLNTYFLVGDADEFIKEAQVKETEHLFLSKGMAVELIRYQGKHEIDENTLLAVSEKITAGR